MNKLFFALVVLSALLLVQADCPNGCSGHGRCGPIDTCTCHGGWTNPDCSSRLCPKGIAWFDTPTSATEAHNLAECSSRGRCDRVTGECRCYPGFDGRACERIECPIGTSSDRSPCSGHGVCRSIYQHYVFDNDGVNYTPWDAHKIYGCKCDRGFTGQACEERMCPRGDDPERDNAVKEHYTIDLKDPSIAGGTNDECLGSIHFGYFTLRQSDLGDYTTITYSCNPIEFSARIKAGFESLRSVREVTVNSIEYNADKRTGATIVVTIERLGGRLFEVWDGVTEQTTKVDHPNLAIACFNTQHATCATAALDVPNSQLVGVYPHTECSGRGICDTITGVCNCFPGFTGGSCDVITSFLYG